MTVLVILAKALVVLAAGFVVWKVLDLPERVDEGRVTSDGIRRTDAATRARLRGEQ